MRFKDKVALITAAGRGIGRATAEIIGREGGTVVAIDNDKAALEQVLGAIRGAGGTAHGADVFRVRHEAATLLARHPDLLPGDVVVRAYSPDTKVQPEILLRTALLASELEITTALPVVTVPASRRLLSDAINVVHGAIPDLASRTDITADGTMTFDGRRVVLLCNSNLLGQVARRDGHDLEELVRSLDPRT